MRWIGRIIFTLVTLGAVALIGLFFIPSERIAAIASDRFEAATGRKLTISGDIRPTLYPFLGVRIEDVVVENAPWAGPGPLLHAEALSVGVAFSGLTSGDIRVRELRFVRPEIDLIRAADGRGNWDMMAAASAPAPAAAAQPAPGAAPAAAPAAIAVDLAQVTDASVRFEDRASGQIADLRGVTAAFRLPRADGAAEMELSGELNGQPLSLGATVEAFLRFVGGDVRPVVAQVQLGGARVDFDGRAGLSPLAVEGDVTAGLNDMTALFAALGQQAPDLPKGLGQAVNVATRFTLAPEGSMHLRGAVIDLDQNRLTGDADLYFDDIPKLRAKLSGGTLDLRALGLADAGGGAAGSPQAPPAEPGWPTTPIDASALAALDAEVALSLDGMDLGAAQIGATDLVARLNRARLVLDMTRVVAYGGTVTGEFVVNNRSGLSVGGDLKVSDIALQPLLTGFAGYDRLIGRGDMTLKFLGVGQSVDAIMKSLRGAGTMKIGQGELLGLDLAGMIRNFDLNYRGAGQKTIFERIQATFSIKDGVLTNPDLDFVAPVLRATGKGTADLGQQTLDYRVAPVALQGADGTGGLSVPVLIRGPWSNLSYSPDLDGLVNANLAEEKARIEAEAKARLEAEKLKAKQKIADELGIEPDAVQTADDLEGAVKDKAEEALKNEAEKALKNLFGLD